MLIVNASFSYVELLMFNALMHEVMHLSKRVCIFIVRFDKRLIHV